jgi:ferritin-like metal-binding protein YciE
MNTLYDLFVDELKDLYSAERQLLKAIPRMMKGTTSDELRSAFETHLEQTEAQVERLEQVFERLEVSPRGKKCKAMEGLVEEGEEVLDLEGDGDVLDAAIIGAAQRVEHYEIAGYGTACAHAKALGYEDLASILGQTLQEEEETDRLLTQIAEGGINRMAAAMEGGEEGTEETTPARRAASTKAKKSTAGRSGSQRGGSR